MNHVTLTRRMAQCLGHYSSVGKWKQDREKQVYSICTERERGKMERGERESATACMGRRGGDEKLV